MSMGKGTIWLLAGSVILNVLMVGAILGVLLSREPLPPPAPTPPGPPGAQMGIRLDARAFIRALPREQRREAITLLRANADKHHAIRKGLMQVRTELISAFKQKDMDQDKIRQLLQKQQALQDQDRALGQDIFLQLISSLDVTTREKVLQQAFNPNRTRESRHFPRDDRRRQNQGMPMDGPPPPPPPQD